MRYVRYRIDPRLAELLGRLDGTPMGQLAQLVEQAEPVPAGDDTRSAGVTQRAVPKTWA